MDEGDPFRRRNYGAIASFGIAEAIAHRPRQDGMPEDRQSGPSSHAGMLLPPCNGRGDARIATPFRGDVKYGKRAQRGRLLLGAGRRDFRRGSVINASL